MPQGPEDPVQGHMYLCTLCTCTRTCGLWPVDQPPSCWMRDDMRHVVAHLAGSVLHVQNVSGAR
eukprot:scaffold14337_cov132-Isochrysis_galbana.AAC.8